MYDIEYDFCIGLQNRTWIKSPCFKSQLFVNNVLFQIYEGYGSAWLTGTITPRLPTDEYRSYIHRLSFTDWDFY